MTVNEKANKLSAELWEMANSLRGNIDSSKFKDYIFGIIFYRFLSEKVEIEAHSLLEDDGCTYEEVCNGMIDDISAEDVYECIRSSIGFYIKPEYLFSTMIKKINKEYGPDNIFTIEDLETAIKEVPKNTSEKSKKVFEGLFDDMRLNSPELGATVSDKSGVISNIMLHVNNIDFDISHPEYDLIGTVYMILIGLFASDAGKKGGEFFTPVGPSKLCVELATYGLKEAKNIADCTCGSASMLLEGCKHLEKGFGKLYGQEKNSTTYNLARMNMILHNIPWDRFHLSNCDTLTNDSYKDKNGKDIKMTVQVCNPPYSAKWSADKSFENDPRYSAAGKLAPKAHADLAFLEHMVYHMDEEDGRVSVLLPSGVLFRSGAEAKIRKYIVEKLNRVDAIITLPSNLFHGTAIPVCLILLKSNRGENADNILLIDATDEFEPGKNQNELTDKNIETIMNAYIERKDIPGFAKVVNVDEIKANDYNLNVARYVIEEDEEEIASFEEISSRINELKNKEMKTEESINSVMKSLGMFC